MSWERAGGVGNARKGYCRFRHVLGRDRGFLVATEFLVLCCDKVLCLVSRQGFPVSRHCSHAVGSCLVAT